MKEKAKNTFEIALDHIQAPGFENVDYKVVDEDYPPDLILPAKID